ncbi:MAG: hypothetical protein ACE366_16255 [Bradymonadia bacterium]
MSWMTARASGPMILGALLAFTSPAQAEFDTRTGYEAFGDDEIGVGFEALSDLDAFGSIIVAAPDGTPLAPEALEAVLERDPRGMIEGQRAMSLGTQVGSLLVTFDNAAPALQGRRVEFRMWYRPEGSDLYAFVRYLSMPVGELPEDSPELFSAPGTVQLLPTGRATDDGWIEISSGPVDFTLAGAVEARAISIIGTTSLERQIFRFASNTEGTTLVDGLTVRDLGPAIGTGEACTRGTESETCAAEATCFIGRCVDALPVHGTVPNSAVRREYLARQVARARLMMGARYALSVMDAFEEQMMGLAEADTVTYWSGIRRAYDDLADGHASLPPRSQGYSLGGGACLYIGEADLLPRGGRHPLVYEVNAEHPLGAQLLPGDAWVAVDGASIDDFRALSDRNLSYPGDPRARDVITTPQLLEAAMKAGATVTFERCPYDGEAAVPCTDETVERFDVDLAALSSGLWEGELLDWRFGSPSCDFRFQRGFDLPDALRGSFVGQREDDGVTTLYINGVSGQGRWANLAEAAMSALTDRVILDQRQGGGGTFQGLNTILEPFLDAELFFDAHIVPQIDPEMTDADRQRLVECASGFGFFAACGGFFSQEIGGRGPRRGTFAQAKLAIVNGLDVSGNDYLPRALQQFRDPELTRIFGPAPTYGAFGPIASLPKLLNEVFGGSFQLHDTQFIDADGTISEFSTGFGVEPDVEIYQKQSDLLLGVDTVMEAARAWLMEGEE